MNPLKASLEAGIVAQLVEIFPPDEDEEALWSAIRDCTVWQELLEQIAASIAEDKCHIAALALREDEIAIRKKRFSARVDRKREMLLSLMRLANLRKAELPEATISITAKPQSVMIVDEGALPDAFLRIKKEPDKKAISDALKAGEGVPGASLSNGGETLIIRAK